MPLLLAPQVVSATGLPSTGLADAGPSYDVARYADVVVDVPTARDTDVFTYEVPLGMTLAPGQLVRVPFGPRVVRGVVVALPRERRAPYSRPVRALTHPVPILSAAQIALARWMSDYYVTTLFQAIAPMLPPGFRTPSRALVRLRAGATPDPTLTPGAQRLFAYLREHPGAHASAALTRRLGPWVPNALRALLEAGLAEHTEAPEPPEPPGVVRMVSMLQPADTPEHLREASERLMVRAPRQGGLALRLARGPGDMPLSEARAVFGYAAVAALLSRGLARTVASNEAAVPRPAATEAGPREQEPALLPTLAQQVALARIRAALDRGALDGTRGGEQPPRAFLLEGVTGSGKTEVYLQALAHCLDRGKQGIVLVPELALTPQMITEFTRRFPGRVGVLHSGLTPQQYQREWWRCFNGEHEVVIGARSAVFAPRRELGLIVVDEEHEWTYKQEEVPRYHARDVALKLGELTGATVVLGSATPDVVTRWRALRGEMGHLTLPQRIQPSGAPAPLADVRVVDMRDELRTGNTGVLSRVLKDALEACLAEGNQAVLFLNRRGSASVVECRACGNVVRCPRCGTPYTFHAGGAVAGVPAGTLLCHQCNQHRGVPSTCPRCRSPRIRYLGSGTQQLVDEVQALFPRARLLRWDRDTAANARAHAALLERFATGKADVLIGTQMIAKGLHFPSVTLVGVVLADIGLHAPDFRAAERTFQVLAQVAGRAGRGHLPGQVIVQTYVPEHPAILAAAAQDFPRFHEAELAQRHALGYPPFGKLIRLTFAHTDEAEAQREASRLGVTLRQAARAWGMQASDVVGPAPAYPPRMRGAWRWHVVLRGVNPRALLDKVTLPAAWAVDVDPVS